MYVGGGTVVEAVGEGVISSSVDSWGYPNKTWVAGLRVVTADAGIRAAAASFALQEANLHRPYDRGWYQKNANGETWYCSELVWAAYLNASSGQLDLEDGPDWTGVSPSEIYDDDDTGVICGHYEQLPKTGFQFKGKSPIDLEVVDPLGRLVSKESFDIPGAIYGEDDEDGDGSAEDWIGIPERLHGQYLVAVIAESGASPTDTYGLEVALEDGGTTVLAEDVQIADIPSEPYVYMSSLAVGGIAELPAPFAVSLEDSGLTPAGRGMLAGAAAIGCMLATAGGWYARRRWLRRRA
jgi:hypothetical protein